MHLCKVKIMKRFSLGHMALINDCALDIHYLRLHTTLTSWAVPFRALKDTLWIPHAPHGAHSSPEGGIVARRVWEQNCLQVAGLQRGAHVICNGLDGRIPAVL